MSTSAQHSPTLTSWRVASWNDAHHDKARREDRIIATGLMLCLAIHAVLLLWPLAN